MDKPEWLPHAYMQTFLPLQIFCWKISIMRHEKIKFSLEEGKSSKFQYLNCVSCVTSIGSHWQVGTSDQLTAGPITWLLAMTGSWWMCCRHFINESCFLKLFLFLTGFCHHCCYQVSYLLPLSPIYLKEISAWRWLFLWQFSFLSFCFLFCFVLFCCGCCPCGHGTLCLRGTYVQYRQLEKMYLKIRKIKILP